MNEQFEKQLKEVTDLCKGESILFSEDDLVIFVTMVATAFYKAGQEHILNLPKTHHSDPCRETTRTKEKQ
jgi:hypothetical protein